MNTSKPEVLVAIRLQKQCDLPQQKDILSMAAETKSSQRRVELPLQPEGRQEAAILAAHYDQLTGKTSWTLYDGASEDACVVWGASEPDSSKVVQAMRDWSVAARMAEGWGASVNKTPSHTFPTLPPSTPGQQNAAPHTTHQKLIPVSQVAPSPDEQYQQPNYQQGHPAQQSRPGQRPYSPDSEMTAPQHWAQSYQQLQPLPPELWGAKAPPDLPIKLGDVLVAAGLIPSRTLQAALTLQNTSQMERRRIGEMLVNSGALPPAMLNAAVRLQEMARQGTIGYWHVTAVLIRMHSTGETLEKALRLPEQQIPTATVEKKETKVRPSDELLEREGQVSDEDQKKLKHVMNLLKQIDFTGDEGTARAQSLLNLFKQAALLDDKTIESANKLTPTITDAVKSLLIKEVIDPITFAAGVDCQKLLDRKVMRPEQAVIALGYCQRSRISIKEAISEMNWDIATDGI
jgi:hypothetical protein